MILKWVYEMSLDKSIKSGKEKRKNYTGAKAVDCTCRNHGSCVYCTESRLHKYKKYEQSAVEKVKDDNGI